MFYKLHLLLLLQFISKTLQYREHNQLKAMVCFLFLLTLLQLKLSLKAKLLCCSHTKENILANMKIYENLKFATNSQKMLRLDKINMVPQECLRSSYASVRILTNFLRTLRFSYKQLAESLANLLRMLQILKNAFTNVKNACERLKNETNTKRVLADFVSLNLFASIHRVKLFYFVFV